MSVNFHSGQHQYLPEQKTGTMDKKPFEMKKEKINWIYSYWRRLIPGLFLIILGCSFHTMAFSQTFVVSFPVGTPLYQNSQTELTVVIEGVSCRNTAINCHKGLVTMVADCKYIYRCRVTGTDTIEVLIRKGNKMQAIGQQIVEIKPPPLPKAYIGGYSGGKMAKPNLLAQQGVGAQFFVGGNHWESCTILSFDLLIVRNGKAITSNQNEGATFSSDSKNLLQQLQPGDKLLVMNIKGCSEYGDGEFKPLEFSIE